MLLPTKATVAAPVQGNSTERAASSLRWGVSQGDALHLLERECFERVRDQVGEAVRRQVGSLRHRQRVQAERQVEREAAEIG